MKVAYFAGSLVKNLDGVSRVLYKIAEYNKYNSIDSVFVSPDVDERIGHPSIPLKGVRLPVYKEYKFATSGLSYVEEKLEESQFVPDLIHLHSLCPAGLAGLKLGKKKNIPVIATYHTHYLSYLQYHGASLLSPLVKKYMRYFYNQCDAVLVPSASLQEELTELGIRHVQVLPHGVDFTVFNKDYYTSFLKEKEDYKTILLYVGRLVWEKNLQVLVEAINKLSEKRSDFVLWMAGTGSAEETLKAQLKNSTFFGFCEGKKLSQLYATAELFIFPSSTETFGNVTLEAMASNTCCIVANARGSADLVRDGQNGLLFDPENPQELASRIESMLDDETRRKELSKEALITSQSYRWKDILDLQKKTYIELIEKKTIG